MVAAFVEHANGALQRNRNTLFQSFLNIHDKLGDAFHKDQQSFNPATHTLQLHKPDSIRIYVEALQKELPVSRLRRMVALLP